MYHKHRQCLSQHFGISTCLACYLKNKITTNDLINAWGIYSVLGVVGEASKRYEASIREGSLFHFNCNNVKKQDVQSCSLE